MKTAIGCLLIMLLSVPAFAFDPPVNGQYKSSDLGGGMSTGRFSESWPGAASLEPPVAGSTTNLESLSPQWWIYCGELINVVLLFDNVDVSGNGIKIYDCDYVGTQVVLAGTGPWAPVHPPVDYTATTMVAYSERKTYLFANHQITSVVADIDFDAKIDGFNDKCAALLIANTEKLGDTDSASLPGGYPGFMDPNTCTTTRTVGHWGSVTGLTLNITDCTVPVEQSTWGGVKAIYASE